jgi:hypothetical protein
MLRMTMKSIDGRISIVTLRILPRSEHGKLLLPILMMMGMVVPVHNITRTLAISPKDNQLYVWVGAKGNVDSNSFRSPIRSFTIQPPYPINFVTGEVFADGVRNEVGLAFDANGTLWGVENG